MIQSLHKDWMEFDFKRAYRDDLGPATYTELKRIIEQATPQLEGAYSVREYLSNKMVNNLVEGYQNILDQCKSLALRSDFTEYARMRENPHIKEKIASGWELIQNEWPNVITLVRQHTNIDALNFQKMLGEFAKKTPEEIVNDEKIILGEGDPTLHMSGLPHDSPMSEKSGAELVDDSIGKVGAASAAVTFERKAKEYHAQSFVWMCASIGLGIVFIIALVYIFKCYGDDLDTYQKAMNLDYANCTDCVHTVLSWQIIKAVSFRVVMVSFLLFLVGVAVKGYFAAMHNYTVFSHKTSAMNAAIYFIDRGRTDEGKDVMMNQAASAIFSHQNTGYNGKPPQNMLNAISDLARKEGGGKE